MEDNKATLTGYQKSPDDGHSYPEVAALPDNSDPTYTGALYEHLPGEAGQPAVRHERRMSPTGAPQGKRLEGNNTVYGTHAVPPVSKKAYKDRTPLGGKLHPGGRRKRSGTVACGAAVLFVGLALVLSIAALVLFVFIHRGILPLPGIETLRANVSALEQRVMDLNNSLNSDPKNDLNVSPTSMAMPTVEPELPAFVDIRVVNFSDCWFTTKTCSLGGAGCSINIPMVPEFLNTSLTERTRVVVEQSCWFSDIDGDVSDLQTANRIFTFENTSFYACDCIAGTFRAAGDTDPAATCNFYYKECALSSVRVQQP